MANEKDYRDSIEEHRQEVELEETPKRRIRSKQQNQRNPMLTALVVIFILFPLSILGYVTFFYEPDTQTEVVKDNPPALQFEKNNDPVKNSAATDDEEKEKAEEKTKAEEEKEKAKAEAEEKAKVEEAKAKAEAEAAAEQEAKAKAKAEEEAKAKAEADRIAAAEAKAAEEARAKQAAEAKAAEEARAKQAAEAKAAEEAKAKQAAEAQAAKEKAKQEAAASSKTHVVKAKENLYRIALTYYSDPASGIQKIKQANNLPDENISVGQTLIIP